MGKSTIEEVIERQVQLEDIESHMLVASGLTEDLYELARQNGENALRQLCELDEVSGFLNDVHGSFQAEDSELSYLEETGLLDNLVLAQRRQEMLDKYREKPEFRLAERVLGRVAINDGTNASVETDSRAKTLDFLTRDPGVVANAIVGMDLVVGRKTAVITDASPKYPEDNQNWLHRPIFGKDRVDAYVADFRGHRLLFLRSGTQEAPDSCVRIEGIKIGKAEHDKPSKAAYALGLKREKIGDLELDDNTLKVVNLRNYKAKKPVSGR